MQLMRGLSTRCHCLSKTKHTYHGDEHFAVIKEGAKMHALRV